MRHRIGLCLCVAALCLVSSVGRAQSTLDSACAAPEHRQFDFWLGHWTVTDSGGRVLGSNEITRVAGNCGLREHWRAARGGEGMSLNSWQPATRKWTQFWIGTTEVLELTGGLNERGHMVLQGERITPRGVLIDRISWIPESPGLVRQEWDESRDGGAIWRRVFQGYYRRTSGPTSVQPPPPPIKADGGRQPDGLGFTQ